MTRTLIFAALAGAVAAGCGRENAPPRQSALAFQEQLDSGNQAYRRGDFERSAAFFNQAVVADSMNLAGWYGVYMAESRLGNRAQAARARAVVAARAPEIPLTAHPTAKDHPDGTLDAPPNPHVPQGDNPHEQLPIDSIRAARGKT